MTRVLGNQAGRVRATSNVSQLSGQQVYLYHAGLGYLVENWQISDTFKK